MVCIHMYKGVYIGVIMVTEVHKGYTQGSIG